MKAKRYFKILSVFLSMLMLISVIPINGAAIEKIDASSDTQNETETKLASDGEILYEINDKRTQNSKTYKKSDGSYCTYLSSSVLHYFDGEEWRDINNTITPDGNGAYKNVSNSFEIKFPETLKENNSIDVLKDGHAISFVINGGDSDKKADIQNPKETADISSLQDKSDSSVSYKNVLKNTDIQYSVNGNVVKENIIIKSKKAVEKTYSYTVSTDLSIEKNNDGSLIFKDAEGNNVFKIPSPVMYDDDKNSSSKIAVTLEKICEGQYILEYCPDEAWLKSKDRTYPVVLDPVISEVGDSVVTNTCVTSSDPDATGEDSLLCLSADNYIPDNSSEPITAITYLNLNKSQILDAIDGAVVTEAQLIGQGCVKGKIAIKEVSDSVNFSNVTFNTRPKLSSGILDYYTGFNVLPENPTTVNFNITDYINRIVNNYSSNKGLALVPLDNSSYGVLLGNTIVGENKKSNIGLLLSYTEVKGYDNRYQYHTQSIDNDETAYVNDFTRDMSIIRKDMALDGNVMPVNISFVYNSSVDSIKHYAVSIKENAVSDVYGTNWISNYNRCVVPVVNDSNVITYNYLTDTGAIIAFNASVNTNSEDNDVIVFDEEKASVIGSSGYSMELLDVPDDYDGDLLDYIVVKRPDGQKERFDKYGRLISVTKTVKTSSGYAEQSINIAYVSDLSTDGNYFAIKSITDGVGRKYLFSYNTAGKLENIKCFMPNGTQIHSANELYYMMNTYKYDGENLVSVTKNSSKTYSYEYNSSNEMVSASVASQYKVGFGYNDNGKVNYIEELAKKDSSFERGNTIVVSSDGPYGVAFKDSTGSIVYEQFDNFGKNIGTYDNKGYYTYLTGKNKDVSGNITSASNLLLNGSFESGINSWDSENIEATDVVDTTFDSGAHSIKFASDDKTDKYISQTVNISKNAPYTLSVKVKSAEANADSKLTLLLEFSDAHGDMQNIEEREITAVGGDFQTYSLQIAPKAFVGSGKITVSIGLGDSNGEFYVDSAMLEEGNGIGEYDYLQNGNFEIGTDNNINGWNSENSYIKRTDIICNRSKTMLSFPQASINNNVEFSQSITLNGKKGDVISFGGWYRGKYVASDTTMNLKTANGQDVTSALRLLKDRNAGFKVTYNYVDDDGKTATDSIFVSAKQYIKNWQYLADDVTLKGDCTEVTFSFVYENLPGTPSIAEVSLHKNSAVTDTLNAENTADTSTGEVVEEPQQSTTITSCICGEDCAYGDGCICSCKSKDACKCLQCKKRFDIVYDDFGNLLSLAVNGYDLNTLISMFNKRSYTSDGNYLTSTVSENDKETTYNYSRENGYLKSKTEPQGKTTSYSYSTTGNLTKSSVALSENSSLDATYGYDNLGRITSIGHNDFHYIISYNTWGNVSRIMVGLSGLLTGKVLVNYTYDEGAYRNRLLKASYANGGYTSYNYDDSGNIIEIRNADSGSENAKVNVYKYSYDLYGNMLSETDIINSEITRTIYYNGNSTEVLVGDRLESYETYYSDGNAVEIVNGTEFVTKSYDSEISTDTQNTKNSSALLSKDASVGFTVTNDSFGRTVQKEVLMSDPLTLSSNYAEIKTDYFYQSFEKDGKPMASSKTETLYNTVSSVTDGIKTVVSTEGCYYEYDDNGNITHEYSVSADGTKTLRYRYTYDKAEQLVRFDDNVNGKSYKYRYDAGGNRTSIYEYPFTLSASFSKLKKRTTASYGFDSGSNYMLWNDRLKTYNGKDIKYDLEGNPVSYDGKSYVWNGKQLAEIKAADGSYTQYNYDASGLRTQKKQYKSDGTLEYSVDYIWKDGKISVQNMVYNIEQEKDGVVTYKPITFTSKFVYFNNENTPSAIILNGQTMLLKKNIQGDVTSIIEPSGETMISFSYDPWGNITYIADESLDETAKAVITAICPVTYRGYNYDFTTGLYYLQSRYYNPEWGRFLNADDTSILLSSVGSPLGANMYAYCNNNPINKIDYNGLSGTDVVKNVVPGLVSIIIISTVFSDLFMGGYEAIDFKQAINDYGLLIANLAIKKQNANKYKILKVVLGGVEQWKNYCADNENDNLGLTKKEIEYIKNSSYYDLEENYYKNTKPQFEGYEQYEGAFHLSLLLGWYLSMEILNARNNSIKNNTYFFHLRNCDAFIAYKKYNASTKRGYLKIINDFSIPKYKDADGTIGL